MAETNKTSIILALLMIIALLSIACESSKKSEPIGQGKIIEEIPAEQGEEGKEAETSARQEIKTYSLDEVAQHYDDGDCWIAIDNQVYDVTQFITMHPGGQAIMQGCGTDATDLYETRPMGSGTPHSGQARSLLEEYYIGDLS